MRIVGVLGVALAGLFVIGAVTAYGQNQYALTVRGNDSGRRRRQGKSARAFATGKRLRGLPFDTDSLKASS